MAWIAENMAFTMAGPMTGYRASTRILGFLLTEALRVSAMPGSSAFATWSSLEERSTMASAKTRLTSSA